MSEVTDAEREAQGEFIRDVVLSIVKQACEQGVDLNHVSAVVLGVGSKGLRLALGPAEAAAVVRRMAEQVEADNGEARH